MARLLRNNDNPGSISLDIQTFDQGVSRYANADLRAQNLNMPLYTNINVLHINAFLSQESLAKWLDPSKDTYL
ncbi:MAG: hypothetical protein IT269_05560, partial [Saprospiraceae bacterium]|nr:hypothetical protein [Saprospiraceae bacterium]